MLQKLLSKVDEKLHKVKKSTQKGSKKNAHSYFQKMENVKNVTFWQTGKKEDWEGTLVVLGNKK